MSKYLLLKLYVIVLSFLLLASKARSVEVFFTPGPACQNQITKAIQATKMEIFAAVHVVNNQAIVNALIAAHQRGVKVRVLTDRTQVESGAYGLLELLSAGIELRLHSVHQLEHNAFGVFDRSAAISGSFNWTQAATELNSENCIVMNEEAVIASYRSRFQELWAANSESKSQAYLAPIIKKTLLARDL